LDDSAITKECREEVEQSSQSKKNIRHDPSPVCLLLKTLLAEGFRMINISFL